MIPGKIIILNGTSSSGKTSIVNALQKMLTEPFLDAGLDKFIWMLPHRYLDQPLWDQVLGKANSAGPLGHSLVRGMHRTIAALSRTGLSVVADHVLVERSWTADCANTFFDLPAYLIGVFCPLEVVEQREKDRKDRTLGQAKAQFDLIHAGKVYDLEIDTSISSPEECAELIITRIGSGLPPRAFSFLKNEASSHAAVE